MTLSDNMAYRQIVGCLMKNPSLLLEYQDINVSDFDNKVARVCFLAIDKLYKQGATKLIPIEVEQEIEKSERGAAIYKNDGGLNFLKASYEFAELGNFKLYYNRLKKYALLRRLKEEKYDISDYYKEDLKIDDIKEETRLQENFDNSSVEDILNSIEGKYNVIRNEFLSGGRKKGDPSEGIFELIEELRQAPNIGPELEGHIFSSACRGARQGCFYLKSASSGSGKTRTSVFDACKLAFPIRWSHEKENFVQDVEDDGTDREPRKVLFIVTEMDKEELQTIMLAYLSGVNEDHILTGKYEDFGKELERVKFAAKIMSAYKDYFIIEEISDPNLVNVESTIKKYATVDEVKFVFFDYIHSTASMVNQFSKNNLNEASILMMMANQIKQIAKDYGLFIFSATQVNASAMDKDDNEFKNEMSIRGSKSISDKCDIGYVMTRVSDKFWNSVLPQFRSAAREGIISIDVVENPTFRPTHVIDIYKMRRGRYKNVRIWTHLHLGTGMRRDLFITTAENEPIENFHPIEIGTQQEISNWQEILRRDDFI